MFAFPKKFGCKAQCNEALYKSNYSEMLHVLDSYFGRQQYVAYFSNYCG